MNEHSSVEKDAPAPLRPQGFVPPHTLAGCAPDGAVLVAFSGGPDSRTLLHLLAADAAQKGYPLYAAHVNHGIRGEEADRDEAFCRSVAEAYGVPLFVLHADIPARAKEMGQSVETAARNARYEYFERLLREHGISLLATAHNANDNLETVVFDLLRGCGLDGLCGIPAVRPFAGGTLVRPLLAVSREEILCFCRAHALSYVTDSTNTDTQYTRNRIRAELIPALRAINPSVLENVTRTCEALRADAEHLRGEAQGLLDGSRCGFSLPTQALCKAPKAIAARALMLLFKELTGGIALEQCHVRALLSLAEQAVPHAQVDLPNGRMAVIEDGFLCLQNRRATAPAPAEYCVTLTTGRNRISQTDCEIIIGYSQNTKNVYKKAIRMYFASDKIVGNIVARNRRPGDRIFVNGMHKDVRRLMCDRKIPLEWRARLPVLCDDRGILAVPSVAMRDGLYVPPEQQDTAEQVQIYFYE